MFIYVDIRAIKETYIIVLAHCIIVDIPYHNQLATASVARLRRQFQPSTRETYSIVIQYEVFKVKIAQ